MTDQTLEVFVSTTDVTVSAEDFAEARYRDDSDARDAFLAYADDAFDTDMTVREWDDIADDLESRYVGCYSDLVEFTRESVIDTLDVPYQLEKYIDWESLAVDWEMDHTTIQHDGGVWVWKD